MNVFTDLPAFFSLLLGVVSLFFTDGIAKLIKKLLSVTLINYSIFKGKKLIYKKKKAAKQKNQAYKKPYSGPEYHRAGKAFSFSKDSIELLVQIVISLSILIVSYIVIINQYDDGTKNWAFGAIGTVLGYWFPRRR